MLTGVLGQGVSIKTITLAITPLLFNLVSIVWEFAVLRDVYVLLSSQEEEVHSSSLGDRCTRLADYLSKRLNPFSAITLICLGRWPFLRPNILRYAQNSQVFQISFIPLENKIFPYAEFPSAWNSIFPMRKRKFVNSWREILKISENEKFNSLFLSLKCAQSYFMKITNLNFNSET